MMRAVEATDEGSIERDGIKVHFEVFGAGAPTVLFLPTFCIGHSRVWKLQVAYLSRHARVVTMDGRGNGRSDRPVEAAAYADAEFVADIVAVLDAVGASEAVLVGLSMGGRYALEVAAEYPDRVTGAVLIAPAVGLGGPMPAGTQQALREAYQAGGYDAYAHAFVAACHNEPHTTKHVEDGVSWALETAAEPLFAHLAAHAQEPHAQEPGATRRLIGRVSCPMLVIQGEADAIVDPRSGYETAEAADCDLVVLEGTGHLPGAREPVAVNDLLRDFVARVQPPRPVLRRFTPARKRRRRALYVSSPIGLGHAQRDLAVAEELRCSRPDLEIEWLAQDPVTHLLEARSETIHPASRFLASEADHIDSEAGEHDLHCFQAIRRMDEILLANFMVFRDLVAQEDFDLLILDEAWEIDHFLHENPHLKRSPMVWFTDFVGQLPMPEGGDHEAMLTADYNAEMLEHVERYPALRDLSLFVGEAEDVVAEPFGADLPGIREWTEEHFEFPGYITGFDPATLGDRDQLRDALGYQPDEQVCVVTVGGSGVGTPLLQRVIASFDEVKRSLPALRMVVVSGPRIDPGVLPRRDGLDIRSYVPDLYRHLAACDIAVVQGGLTTCMELVANRRPFLYFPLRNHFEQTIHVHHRLQRHGAGRRMDYLASDPDELAEAIVGEFKRDITYRPVRSDGAARAAQRIATLL